MTHSTTPSALSPTHPLDRLTADEIKATRALFEEFGLVSGHTRFPVVTLEEPPKHDVLAFESGSPIDRRVRALLLDTSTGEVREVVASLTRNQIDGLRTLDPITAGQPPVMLEDFIAVDEIVKGDAGWRAAMERRGIKDLGLVCPCPLSAGSFELPGEQGKRLLRVLSFLQHHPKDHPWAHPIDGVVAYVDLIEKRVVEVIDDAVLPIPQEEGNFDDPEQVGPPRTTLKPIEITQPDGPSFTVEGDVVSWENWRFRLGFDPREGLVLHQLSFADGGRERPIIYRASVCEMVVPYADPSRVRFWQNYFDAGEYLLGHQANTLTLGCDCLGEIHYFDAVLADEHCEPKRLENAICMHEEDYGVLWKHTDLFTESAETRRQRRLVISFFVTVGNYDYGFYWYLYLDGTIQLECKATGVVFTSSYPGAGYPWATEIAPGLGAPHHQHLFSARLDMTVDGVNNAVEELDVVPATMNDSNQHGNAFTRNVTRLASEREGARRADANVGRVWHVINPEVTNRLGQPVGYELVPQGLPTLLADPKSSIAKRAGFATRNLWVTAYDPAERYAAGDLVNQHAGGAGLPSYIAEDRPLDGADVVLWHTFGLTHFVRTEDWPVMPVDDCGFTLRPVGFFDRNPTLDVPPTTSDHCAGGTAEDHGEGHHH